MLICVDIGNTRVSLGLYHGAELRTAVHLSSAPERTPDEYGALLRLLLADALEGADVIMAGVSPVVEGALFAAFERYAQARPRRVTASQFPYLENRAERPYEVGVDRLINAYAAKRLFGAPVIVVDLGTATTWDVVSRDGAYLGGAIAPGLELASQALFSNTARLPRVRIEKPPAALGRSTITAMESGLYYGLVGAVNEITTRISRELNETFTVVATGGLAALLAEECQLINKVEPHLTLEGLRMIAQAGAA